MCRWRLVDVVTADWLPAAYHLQTELLPTDSHDEVGVAVEWTRRRRRRHG
jgi:hypothetical protein